MSQGHLQVARSCKFPWRFPALIPRRTASKTNSLVRPPLCRINHMIQLNSGRIRQISSKTSLFLHTYKYRIKNQQKADVSTAALLQLCCSTSTSEGPRSRADRSHRNLWKPSPDCNWLPRCFVVGREGPRITQGSLSKSPYYAYTILSSAILTLLSRLTLSAAATRDFQSLGIFAEDTLFAGYHSVSYWNTIRNRRRVLSWKTESMKWNLGIAALPF